MADLVAAMASPRAEFIKRCERTRWRWDAQRVKEWIEAGGGMFACTIALHGVCCPNGTLRVRLAYSHQVDTSCDCNAD